MYCKVVGEQNNKIVIFVVKFVLVLGWRRSLVFTLAAAVRLLSTTVVDGLRFGGWSFVVVVVVCFDLCAVAVTAAAGESRDRVNAVEFVFCPPDGAALVGRDVSIQTTETAKSAKW